MVGGERLKLGAKALLVAVLALGFALWADDEPSAWLLAIMGAVSLAFATGAFELAILAGDDWERTRVAPWHVGQLVIASVVMTVLGALGTAALVVAVLRADACPASWGWRCSVMRVALYVIATLYALVTLLLWPVAAWWDWFGARARRRRKLEAATLAARRKQSRDHSLPTSPT